MTGYRVVHRTAYEYGATMSDGYSVTCLSPRDTEWQTVRRFEIELEPAASEIDDTVDVFGNRIHQFGFHEPHEQMAIEAVSEVDLRTRPAPVDPLPWEQVAATSSGLRGDDALSVGMFRSSSTLVDLPAIRPVLQPLVDEVFTPGVGIVDALTDLCRRIHATLEFDAGFSTVSTPLADVVAGRRGVCQDFAHVAIACSRLAGLAARYVSGYIETVPPPGQDRLVGADASHAWCSVWTPGAGWVDFDPTNGHLPVNDHVTTAWGRDYADVIPVRGVMIGPAAHQRLEVSVDVSRLDAAGHERSV